MAVTTPRLQEVTAQQPQVAYRFVKVEDYFSNYRSWNTLGRVIAYEFDSSRTLALTFQRNDEKNCVMLIQFLRKDIMRVCFNPSKDAPNDYPPQNNRTIVQDTIDQLMKSLKEVTVEFRGEPQHQQTRTLQAQEKQTLYLTTKSPDQQPFMEVMVQCNPFRLTVLRSSGDRKFQVWTTASPGIYYTPNGNEDYAIIQAVDKPATAKYIGFGEQGGKQLSKNTAQLVYFNFDNMRYRQVYDHGAFEEREALYHSDPFFMEFNGVPDQESVYGIFVDNYSQVCVDVGYFNSSRYMFGTRFGDLNYYFLLGQTCADVLDAFTTTLVGKPKLKPRYVLGYHQGCYGYEKRQDLEDVVKKYREYGIPLDGLHIDVDIQQNYRTFTIDESKFPNPQEMFARLREQGVKCSTNITPIISNKDPNYTTYQEGLARGYFVLDKRSDPDNPDGRRYQDYGGGSEHYYEFTDPEQNFNSGKPYIGEVYYGENRGTTGHYPDLGRREVRDWWGTQYQYLFDMGLEMVWQDMTTPAIRNTRGDMRGFPFRLVVTDDSLSNVPAKQTPAIKVWNLYSYDLHKATYHGLNHLAGRENKRNFIIGRGCFSGVNRFAGLWTGDNASSWQFLKMNVFQVLALGLCGVVICGEDIGGFESEEDWQHWADPELLIRWTCVGAFLPWFRNHYIAKGRKYFQEPYAYQFVNLDYWNIPQEKRYLYGSVLPICKYYIELRYRLLQLFYDAMFENILDGMPICRAMFLNDPGDKALYNDKLSFLDNQFFIRKDLLISPILDPQADFNAYGKCDVYLPAGSDWYAFMDNKWPLMPAVEGGTTIHDYDAHIDDNPDHIGFIVPIYVRAGAIIPTIELEQYIGQLNVLNQPNPITLNIYPMNIPPGQDGEPTSKPYEYIMYLDDGVSRSSAPKDAPQYRNSQEEEEQTNSEYRETHITHAYLDRKTREIKVERTHDKYTPKFETYFFVAVLHDPAEPKGSVGPLKSISIQRDGDRQKVDPMTVGTPEQRAEKLKTSITDAWYYNENVNISFIKVIDNNKLITITAEYIS